MTGTLHRRLLLLLVLALLPLHTAHAKDKPPRGTAELRELRKEAKSLEKGWQRFLRKSRKARARVEAARLAARRDERVKTPTLKTRRWEERWNDVETTEVSLGLRRRIQAWSQALTPLHALDEGAPLDASVKREVHALLCERVAAWITVGEPDIVRQLLVHGEGRLRWALELQAGDTPRRALVAAVLARSAATPGHSDVQSLAQAVDWCGIILGPRTPTTQLDLLSRDLILLLTERGVDGISLSKAAYYVPGRFRDRGFAERFRDGSDQVRHFVWAFRMFAASANADATEWFLTMKEQRDATTRKQPLNKADVALNKAARTLVEDLRGPAGARIDRCLSGGRVIRALSK